MGDDNEGENMSSDVFLAGQIVGYSVESEPDDDHGAGMPIFKASRDEGTSESSDSEDGEAPARTVFPADAGDAHCYSEHFVYGCWTVISCDRHENWRMESAVK